MATRGEDVCCSLGMTGLKITMMWRSKTRRADGWGGPGCRKEWAGLPGYMR